MSLYVFKAMVTQNDSMYSFCIVPAIGQQADKPMESWSNRISTTYVFTISYTQVQQFSHLGVNVHSKYAFPDSSAAAVFGRLTKGISMGKTNYYMGDLGPLKRQSLYQISVTDCDEPRVQSTLKGFTKVCQRLQRLGEAKGFTTSACGASVSIAKDVQ